MNDFLTLSFVFLMASLVIVPFCSRFGLGSVTGYLVAGVLISPILAILNVDVISIQHFAEFGVVILLFVIGLDVKPNMIWGARTQLIGLGSGQIVLTSLMIAGLAMLMGLPWTMSLAIGVILSLSSTALVVQTLNENNVSRSDGGQSCRLVLLAQNIAVLPLLALLPLLAVPEFTGDVGVQDTHTLDQSSHDQGHGTSHPQSLIDRLSTWQVAVVTIGSVGFVIIASSYLTGPMFRYIAVARVRELFTAAALFIVIGISLLMSFVGLSPALGAFLAGVVLANSDYRHELESVIDPFRGLLLGAFFISVGAGINVALLFSDFAMIAGLAMGVVLVKVLVLLALAWVFQVEGSDRWLFSLGLAQSGEFGFVLLSFAVAVAVLPSAIAQILLLVIVLTMLSTPFLFFLANKLSGQKLLGTASWAEDLTVFISYSRHDKDQMQAISHSLESRGITVKVDTRDLPFGEKWQAELSYLIGQSDIVIWLVSEKSISSHWCNWELGEVARFRKKLVPIVVGEVLPEHLPRIVKKIQLLPAQGVFQVSRKDHMKALLQVLGSDAVWIKTYSRLNDRAHAWDEASRNKDRLLSIGEVIAAEEWLSQRPPLAPEPMPLVLDFIHSSRIRNDQNRLVRNSEVSTSE